jgi:Mg-chelatase subunit ChlD
MALPSSSPYAKESSSPLSAADPDSQQLRRTLESKMLPIKLCFFLLFTSFSNAYLIPRDAAPVCTDLSAQSNDGDRKMAVVIDSSGSMELSDPSDLRLAAGKSVVDWLITKGEATNTKKQDLVTIINFDDEANLDYPLGDPAGADSSLDEIGADGGTYIAGGVEMAVTQLTASGTGDTSGRSGIVVFTDGQVRIAKLFI